MTERVAVYDLYGLRVRSEIALSEPPAAPGGADVEVLWAAARPVPAEPGPGAIVAELVVDQARLYTITADAQGYLLRLHGACDVRVSLDLATVACAPDPTFDRSAVPIFLVGTIAAFLLSMAGACVLHGAAVEHAGCALALVGPSGVGKSTLASLLCAAGARLVTDDVVRVELSVPVRCVGRCAELRLRAAASSIVDLFPVRPDSRPTADGRLAVRPDPSHEQRPALGAIVLPRPARGRPDVLVTPARPADAMLVLLSSSRISGWHRREEQTLQFENAARLSTEVPLFYADIPWGPPFSLEVGEQLLDRVAAKVP